MWQPVTFWLFADILLLGAGRRPRQGSASVFCYYYYFLCFLCSEFPARLQSLNSVTKPEHIQRGRNFRYFTAGRRYKVTAEIASATPRRMIFKKSLRFNHSEVH